jgi:hypothetical protein
MGSQQIFAHSDVNSLHISQACELFCLLSQPCSQHIHTYPSSLYHSVEALCLRVCVYSIGYPQHKRNAEQCEKNAAVATEHYRGGDSVCVCVCVFLRKWITRRSKNTGHTLARARRLYRKTAVAAGTEFLLQHRVRSLSFL